MTAPYCNTAAAIVKSIDEARSSERGRAHRFRLWGFTREQADALSAAGYRFTTFPPRESDAGVAGLSRPRARTAVAAADRGLPHLHPRRIPEGDR